MAPRLQGIKQCMKISIYNNAYELKLVVSDDGMLFRITLHIAISLWAFYEIMGGLANYMDAAYARGRNDEISKTGS